MNNNRNNNNRRRGRGNRQQGGGNPVNRIDSRARGNAPQMLDKYKKLAQDAQHNGDRVQAEYYLQFADHYFRVIADNRLRQEESRGRPHEQRQRGQDEDADDEMGERDGWQEQQPQRGRGNGRDRSERNEAASQRQDRDDLRDHDTSDAEEAEARSDEEAEARPRRAARPPRDRGPAPRVQRSRDEDGPEAIDAAVLPPAFKVGTEEDVAPAKPAPRRRRKPASEDEGEAVRAVG
ncbi:DUF4167 domain-containing protein [Porphyrobacter sp. GA68]|uniref:DUF4167 domain-containing protein n=1 Tax=Porphyrobacter sp. GA68 TaxID=2883480 RepID=UPI001D18653D|nr:DUF4167 domain-containing protein [Porphyrobacter sp. GA68]